MMRITIDDAPPTLTFRLEGKLAGSWVRELEECWNWRSVLTRQPDPILCLDLTDVTSLDAAGRACLAVMYREGAKLIAADCLMKAVVDEIVGLSAEGTEGRSCADE